MGQTGVGDVVCLVGQMLSMYIWKVCGCYCEKLHVHVGVPLCVFVSAEGLFGVESLWVCRRVPLCECCLCQLWISGSGARRVALITSLISHRVQPRGRGPTQ